MKMMWSILDVMRMRNYKVTSNYINHWQGGITSRFLRRILALLLRKRTTQNTSFIMSAVRYPFIINGSMGKQILYDRSVAVLRRSFRYSSLVRLMILKSVHDAFYEYATRHATEMYDFLLTLIVSFFYRMPNDDGAELIY